MGKLAEHYVEIGARLDKFNKGMSTVQAKMTAVGQKMTAVGKSMTMKVTLPLLAVGTAAVKMGADFDKAMTESLAIMGDVSDAMRKDMRDAALEMSTKTTFAAKELAEAYFFLASAGMNAAQSIKALPVVAKFAQAGAFDLATATDLLTDAQTALGLSSKDATENQKNLIKVSDVLVKANTLANASVQQFSESLTNRAAAALVNVNKSMEEGVAVLAAYADKGVKGQVAGMRLAMMLNALDIAARKNQKAWKENGLALFDAQGEMRSMGDIIGDLEGLLGNMTTEQRSATLATLGFNVRTKASILTLMGSSEKIKQWEKDLKSAGGTTEIVANKQMQAFSNQMVQLKNILVKVGIQLGDILMPIIKDLVDNHIKPAIERFSNLSEETKKTIVKVAGLVAIMGPLLIVFGNLLKILPLIITSMKKMGLTATGLKASLVGVKGVLSRLPAIGMAAFAGWQIGRLIGQIKICGKSIDEHISGALEKAIEKLGLFKSKAELAADRTELMANKQKMLAKASEITGKEVTSINDAFDILKEQYKKTGDLGSKTLNDWAEKATVAEKKTTEFKESTENLSKAQVKLKESSKAVSDTIKVMTDEIMEATLSEYEYRRWAAQKIYEERKQLLKDEEADKAAFVLLEKAHAEELKKIEEERTETAKEQYKARGAGITAAFETMRKRYEQFLDFTAKYTDIIQKYTLSEFDYKKARLDEWYKDENKKLKDALGDTAEYYIAKANLDEAYAEEEKELLKDKKIDWEAVAKDISDYWTKGIAAMIAGTASFRDFVANSFNILAAGVGSTIGNMVKNLVSSIGAMAGPVGAIIGGIVTSALTAIGKLFGIKSKAEKEAEKAKKEAEKYERQIKSVTWATKRYGDISEETAKKIVESSKRMDQQAAILKHLGDVIKDVGVNQRNINSLWVAASEVIVKYEESVFNAVDASESLDKSFKLLLEGAEDLGEEGSYHMTKFILAVRESGLEVKTIAQYTVNQLQRIPKALTDLVAGIPNYEKQFKSLNDEIARLKGELGGIEEGTAAYGEKTREIMAFQKELVELTYRSKQGYYNSGEEVRNLGSIALHTFNSLISSGVSWTDTVEQMKEPLATLRDKYKELGVGAGGAIKRLFDIVGITEKHKELFTSIEANKEILEALGNSGWLTADAMESMTKQTVDYYNRLKMAGASSDEALRAIAPTLQKINDYAKAYGMEIDDATKGRIEEAKAIGLVKEAEVDRVKALGDLFARFGDRMERIFGRFGDQMEGTFGGGGKSFQKGGTFTVPKPTMIQVHPNELIDITPFSKLRPALGIAGTGGGTPLVSVTYAPVISAVDRQDVYRFMTGPGRDAFEKMIRSNVRGIAQRIKEETEKF